jgi:hypothetical protein
MATMVAIDHYGSLYSALQITQGLLMWVLTSRDSSSARVGVGRGRYVEPSC